MSIRDDYMEYCQQAPRREPSIAPAPVPPTSEQPADSLYVLPVSKVERDTDKALLVRVQAGILWVPKSISYLAKDGKSIALESWFEVKFQEEEEQ